MNIRFRRKTLRDILMRHRVGVTEPQAILVSEEVYSDDNVADIEEEEEVENDACWCFDDDDDDDDDDD